MQLNLWYALAAVLAVLTFQRWWTESQRVETIPYSQFVALVEQDQVKEAYVTDQFIHGTLKAPIPDGRTLFITTRVELEVAAPDCAVRELIRAAYDTALAVLRQNRAALEEGARLLLEKETLTREELPPLAEFRLAAASPIHP